MRAPARPGWFHVPHVPAIASWSVAHAFAVLQILLRKAQTPLHLALFSAAAILACGHPPVRRKKEMPPRRRSVLSRRTKSFQTPCVRVAGAPSVPWLVVH